MPVVHVGGHSADSRKRYPLKASENGRFLRQQDGTPFYMVGDSPQSLFVNVSLTDAETYISTRAKQGFNAMWVNILCADYTFGRTDGKTFDLIAPFSTGTGPSSYDLATQNSTYWARMDSMMALLNKYGILAVIDPIETGSWIPCLTFNGLTKAQTYGAWIGARYASYPNLLWLSGNDFQTWSTSSTNNNLVAAVMAGIASASPHLQSIELDFNISESLQNSTTAPYTTVNSVYVYYPLYDAMLTGYGQSPTMPTIMVESNYEGENNTGQATDTPLRNRMQMWWVATCGSSGQLSASFPAYRLGFGATDWVDNLSTTWVTQFAGYHQAFMKSIPWYNLVPDSGNAVLTSGFGTYDGSSTNLNIASNDYATCAVDSTTTGAASLAVIYTPTTHSLVVNMAKFRGTVTGQWFDPSNGTYQAASGSPFTNTGSHTFTIPGANNGGDHDWVLLLTA